MATKRRGPRYVGNRVAGTAQLAAPVGGLNDRDALAAMPSTDAVILTNWWVEPSRLVTRSGSVDWATGFADPVESIIEYSPPSGVPRIFAASGGAIYDISNAGEISSPVVSGQTSDHYETVAASTPAGNFLYALNGLDDPLLYDGTNWTPINGSSTPISITGVTASSLVQGVVFKGRAFFVEKDSLSAWYLPVGQVGGAVKELDLGTIFQRGGYLVGLFTWTLDAGNGSDDHLVCISSNGEVAVYGGYDVDSIESWYLVGLFYLGRPIGRRCAVKYGGDLLVLCEQGIYPLARGLLSSSIDRSALITDKVQNSINRAINAHRTRFGWQMCVYPEKNALILNVPTGIGRAYQLVQNSITQAWTMFEGWNANVFINSVYGLLYGDGNSVKRAWVGNSDGGQPIVADGLQAFSDFGQPAQNKFFTLVRPYLQSDGNPAILFGINGDYAPQDVTGQLSYTPPGGMIWGQMVWGEMQWGGSMRQLGAWATVGGVYKAAAMRIKVQNNNAAVEWAGTDLVFSRGGVL